MRIRIRRWSAQQERSDSASKSFKSGEQRDYKGAKTVFRGYDTLSEKRASRRALSRGLAVDRSARARRASSSSTDGRLRRVGGQGGDSAASSPRGARASRYSRVRDTQKIQPEVLGHTAPSRRRSRGAAIRVAAQVDSTSARATMRHPLATHLMHKAAGEVLGGADEQKGSWWTEGQDRSTSATTRAMRPTKFVAVRALVNAEGPQERADARRA